MVLHYWHLSKNAAAKSDARVLLFYMIYFVLCISFLDVFKFRTYLVVHFLSDSSWIGFFFILCSGHSLGFFGNFWDVFLYYFLDGSHCNVNLIPVLLYSLSGIVLTLELTLLVSHLLFVSFHIWVSSSPSHD